MFLDFVLRAVEAGHEVRWHRYADKGKVTRDGEGFKGFRIVSTWQDHMPWAKAGLIVVTGNFVHIHELDRFRDLGYRIFGPTTKSARLEIVREAGMAAMKAIGIDTPPYQTFGSLQEAADFARKSDKCWVFKPMGAEGDKSLTYVSCDPADMVGWLQRQIKAGKRVNQCMLQEKIDMLSEFGVSGWMGPEGFLPGKWQECVEHKKLMDGEIGPATGEQGSVCAYVEQSKLADEMLKPLEPALRVLGHTGDIAIGVGIDIKGKAWFFEFTARCGYPAWWIQAASHKGDAVQWMRDLLDGKDSLRVTRDVAIGVVLSQPMYPYAKSPPELVEGNPISGLDDVWDDVHPCQMMIGRGPAMDGKEIVERPIFLTSGEYVMVATGTGRTIEKARKAVYGVVDQVKFPNMMYRQDIGEKVIKVADKLHRFGYALGMLTAGGVTGSD